MTKQISSKVLKQIPDYVLKELDGNLQRELAADGFGLSFPCKSGCQMRLFRNKQNLGGFYSYRQFGGIRKAVLAAMNKNRTLRALLHPDENSFVYFKKRFDKRRSKEEWSYQVSYRRNGKSATKTFSMGYREPSAAKCVHAYLTARLFRFYLEELGEEFDASCFKDWKVCRLYMLGCIPFDWTFD